VISAILQRQRTKWVNAQVARFGISHKQAQTYYHVHDPLNHDIIKAIVAQFPETREFIERQLLESE
jgi:hypothetical protein